MAATSDASDASAPLITRNGASFEKTHPDVYAFLLSIGVRGELCGPSVQNAAEFLGKCKRGTTSPHIYATSNGVYFISCDGAKVVIYSLTWSDEGGNTLVEYDDYQCDMFMGDGWCVLLKGILCHSSNLDPAAAALLAWIGVAPGEMTLYDMCKAMAYLRRHPTAKPTTTEDGRQIYRIVVSETDPDRSDVCTTDIYYLDGNVVCHRVSVITRVKFA